MGPLSQNLVALAALLTGSTVICSPLATKIETIKRLTKRDTFEWTSLGDSYASGVGAGEFISGTRRCLRYDGAFPSLINADNRLPGGNDRVYHNDVCSGSSTKDVNDYQFLKEDSKTRLPDWQHAFRERFGQPQISVLSVGGNDIDFPGILANCILEFNIPIPGAGPPKRTCDEQIDVSSALVFSPDLEQNVAGTIKNALKAADDAGVGKEYRLYVTGFPRFFNEKTDLCDKVTFARTANPKDDGLPHEKMTKERRGTFNAMSIQLNKAIENAVAQFKDKGNVKWMPIDDIVEGHRFCEEGVKEPQDDPGVPDNRYLFHYPYNDPDTKDAPEGWLEALAAADKKVGGQEKFKTYVEYQNALYGAVEGLEGMEDSPSSTIDIQDPGWRWVGHRARMFHPKPVLHEKIRDMILDQYIKDIGGSQQGQPADGISNQCFFNMVQYYRCEPEGEMYFATVDMRKPDGLRIDNASLGNITAANEKSPLKIKGDLGQELIIVGSTKNGKGFAEFQYGDYKWNLDEHDAKKDGSCEAPKEWSTDDLKCNGLGKRQFMTEDKDPRAIGVGFSLL